MLVEQNIEFEWRGPGPPGRTFTPITGEFNDKTKISKKDLQVNYYLLLKVLQQAMFLTSLYLGQIYHLQLKFSNKLQDF